MPNPPAIFGLLLAGGASTRMHQDKAALSYHGKPQLQRGMELLAEVCERAFLSVRADQTNDPLRAGWPQIVDQIADKGPIAGILSALTSHPQTAWLVLACDLPFVDQATLQHLISQRDPARIATAYRSSHDGLPEPLCAIFEPRALALLTDYVAAGKHCPRKFLIQSDVKLCEQPDARALDNVNTAEEYRAVTAQFNPSAPSATRTIRVQYYALLREQAGRSNEQLTTTASTPAELYAELRQRYPFRLEPGQLKVAVNMEFTAWSAPLREGDAVVFIPPVAGG